MKFKNAILMLCFTLLFCTCGKGQLNSSVEAPENFSNNHEINSNSAKVLNAIRAQKPAEEIAGNYSDLAESFIKSADYLKAASYMNKAIEWETSGKGRKNLAGYYRRLAQIQELQKEYQAASLSFEKAAELSTESLQKELNSNDAIRLKRKSSPGDELELLNKNGVILSNGGDQSEKFLNFTQQANLNMAMNNNGSALDNFNAALNTVPSNSLNSVMTKSEIASLMASNHDFGNAIALQKDVVKESRNLPDVETQVAQMRNLSSLYFRMDSADAGLNILLDAYNLAVVKGNLKEAKESLVLLADFYGKNKDNQKVTKLYGDFISGLDNLLSRDSSLIDKRLFLVNEGKIAELEQQQTLKDELIQRKNRFNFVLIGSVLLLSALLLLIVKGWLSIRKRNKQIALQSLRREMNPHFIFNSLNSVNQFIANNDEREANKYLTSYSNLMRNIMENSNKDYITLNAETEQLRKYLELEKLRFADKFEYQIEIDPDLNGESVMVPNMVIQPNLENAIWHGLRYRETKGILKLKFKKEGKRTIVTVDDNGIGLTESTKIKTKNQKLHESLGLKNVRERIRLLNEIYKSGIRFDLMEKSGEETGVRVRIEW